MNKLEVNQVGGFPMTTRILDEIQKAHAVFNSLGGLAGNYTIIAGCVTIGSTVGDGFVFINGEVFDFKGGLAQTKVIIKEEVENLTFQNGNANPVIKTRYVTFGTGVGAINWADFKRIDTVVQLMVRLESLEKKTAVFQSGGGMVLWNKPAADIPDGWQEVVDWRGRMPVGWNPSDIDFDTMGKAGGDKTHALTASDLPEHTHSSGSYGSGTGTGPLLHTGKGLVAGSDVVYTRTGTAGSAVPTSIKHMNPYRVVLFIEYIG
jgi:hypothetical protein